MWKGELGPWRKTMLMTTPFGCFSVIYRATSENPRKAFIVGTPGSHLTPEEALRRVTRHELPVGLTRRALDAYDRLAASKINSGQDTVRVTVNGQTLGQQAFRRQLIGKAYLICRK